jgi:iron complex transport system ATP-binding protein
MAEEILDVRGLTVRLGDTLLLDDISLTVRRGEFLAVIGPNGAGKSTLLRCLDGLLAPTAGRIEVAGRPLASYRRRELARIISYVPQSELHPQPFTVATFVAMARYPHLGAWGAPRATDVEAIRSALQMTATASLAERSLDSLSGGERQRVLIAAALAQGGEILLLDEPTTFLDYRHQALTIELLDRLHGDGGRTIVAATHDLNRTVASSDAVLALREGRAVLAGATSEIYDRARLAEVYGTSFELYPTGQGPPLVVPARNGA